MSYTRNRARRGPPPAPFHQTLRRLIDGLQTPQAAIADALGVSVRTIECWLAGPEVSWGRVPHRLMQIGATSLLITRLANRKKGKTSMRWEVTTRDGVTREVPELAKWIRDNLPGENPVSVAAAIRTKGVHKKTGVKAQKLVFKEPPKAAP